MLPFLQPKKLASVIIAKHKKDGPEPIREEDGHAPELTQAAETLIGGFHAKDAQQVAKALTDAFTAMRSEPQVGEGQK